MDVEIKRLIDTNNLLDACGQCGSKIVVFKNELVESKLEYWVECAECSNAISRKNSQAEAMISWNRQQRQ